MDSSPTWNSQKFLACPAAFSFEVQIIIKCFSGTRLGVPSWKYTSFPFIWVSVGLLRSFNRSVFSSLLTSEQDSVPQHVDGGVHFPAYVPFSLLSLMLLYFICCISINPEILSSTHRNFDHISRPFFIPADIFIKPVYLYIFTAPDVYFYWKDILILVYFIILKHHHHHQFLNLYCSCWPLHFVTVLLFSFLVLILDSASKMSPIGQLCEDSSSSSSAC